jgi:5-hydroxyisourate hydrolase
MSLITTHILDTTIGKPAQGVTIILYQQKNNQWKELAKGVTNRDGRITDLISKDVVLELGIYKLRFLVKEYFDWMQTTAFYPFIEITFELRTQEHYHIPLLLNPFGYSTYRGS